MSSADRELEAKLIIASDRADEILEALAAIDEIAGCRFLPLANDSIRDVYFDLPDGALTAADLALRLRHRNLQALVGLKGKARRRGCALERLEVERPWSASGLAEVLDAVRAGGVALDRPEAGVEAGEEPETILGRLGLEPIQARVTQRSRRRILAMAGTPRGELAFDQSLFELDRVSVRHFEVEIESIEPAGFPEMEQLVGYLAALYPGELRPWEHSKVATGRAIAHLLAERSPLVRLDADERLDAMAYDAIDRWLSEAG